MSTLTATIQADTSGFNSAVEKASKELKLFDKSNKNLADTMKKTNKVSDLQVEAFNKSVTALNKVKNGYTTNKQSAKILKDEIEKLTRQYKGLSDEAKKGEIGKSMSNVINKAKIELKSLDIELEKSTNKTKKFYEGLSKSSSLSTFNFANLTSIVTNMGNIFSQVANVVESLTDKLKENESIADAWGRTISGIGNMYSTLVSNVTKPVKVNIVSSFQAGQRAYDAADEFGSYKANNVVYQAKLENDIANAKARLAEGEVVSTKELKGLKKRAKSLDSDYYDKKKESLEADIAKLIGTPYDSETKKYIRDATQLKMYTLIQSYLSENNKGQNVLNSWVEYEKSLRDKIAKLYAQIKDFRILLDRSDIPSEQKNAIRNNIQRATKTSQEAAKEADIYRTLIDSEAQLQELQKSKKELIEIDTERLRVEKEISKLEEKSVKNYEEKNKAANNQLKAEKEIDKLRKHNQELEPMKAMNPTQVMLLDYSLVESDQSNYDTYRERLERKNKELDFKLFGINEQKFKFKDYKPVSQDLLDIEIESVNKLAGAWQNLWDVIDSGNETLDNTMSAMGGTVMDFANMYVELSKIQFQAAQATALAKGNESASGLPFPYNIAAMSTVTSFVMSTFARFRGIGQFAEGGIVGGSSTIGDYNIARVNSGEMILNGSQQRNLFNLLNNGTSSSTKTSGGDIKFRIEGKDLVGTFKNYNNRLNRVR